MNETKKKADEIASLFWLTEDAILYIQREIKELQAIETELKSRIS